MLVENFRRGVLERLGLGWDALIARNPRLIQCSITSQGEVGPEAGVASYGSSLEANSGLADLTRDRRGAPLISGILLNYPDQIVSIYAAGLVSLAVIEQRRTRTGARLDISQRELASFLVGEHILAATSEGSLQVTYPTQPAVHQVATRLVRAAGGQWLLCHGHSSPVLEGVLAELAPDSHSKLDAVALVSALALRDVQSVAVRNGHDLFAAVTRGETRLAFARTPDGTEVKGVPFALASHPHKVARPAPWLGQHNGEVLREILGLDEARIAKLAAAGVIGTAPKA